jgi:hypothetical protein
MCRAHTEPPFLFLREIAANRNNGKIYIEVPLLRLDMPTEGPGSIFYEHVNYFRISDFHRMFGTIYLLENSSETSIYYRR